MSVAPDHYAVLGIARTASAEDIKRAFRRLAREWHPDVNPDPDAAARFQLINQAHEVLSDADQRRAYDAQVLPPISTDWRQEDGAKFEDLLDTLFSSGPRAARPGGRGPERGADILQPVQISLTDAARGRIETITYPARLRCGTCQGTGGAPGATLIRCSECSGQGEISEVTDGPFGRFVATRPCPECHGDGEVISAHCADCSGSGRIRAERTTTIEIPAGVMDGQKIQVAGAGHDGDVGARSGELIAAIHVTHDPRFVRDGLDVVSILEVPVLDAMLGASAPVPTLSGEALLDVPAGTSHGEELRLTGRGMPALDGRGRGDHRFRVHLAVPAAISGEARAALQDARTAMTPLESARMRLRPQPRAGD